MTRRVEHGTTETKEHPGLKKHPTRRPSNRYEDSNVAIPNQPARARHWQNSSRSLFLQLARVGRLQLEYRARLPAQDQHIGMEALQALKSSMSLQWWKNTFASAPALKFCLLHEHSHSLASRRSLSGKIARSTPCSHRPIVTSCGGGGWSRAEYTRKRHERSRKIRMRAQYFDVVFGGCGHDIRDGRRSGGGVAGMFKWGLLYCSEVFFDLYCEPHSTHVQFL